MPCLAHVIVQTRLGGIIVIDEMFVSRRVAIHVTTKSATKLLVPAPNGQKITPLRRQHGPVPDVSSCRDGVVIRK